MTATMMEAVRVDGPRDGESSVARMRAVTISRECGCGAEEIAAHLAHRLGWSLVDHQIAAQIARTLNESERAAALRDEQVCGFFDKLIDALQWASPVAGWECPQSTVDEEEQRHHDAVHRYIRAAVQIGHVVIVGRGSQAVLAGRRDVLRLRFVAPLERRIAAVSRREGMNRKSAEAYIRRKDQERAHYLRTVERLAADDPLLYDLIINTAALSLDQITEIAAAALAAKAEQLDRPDSDFGPAAMDPCPADVEELWIRRF